MLAAAHAGHRDEPVDRGGAGAPRPRRSRRVTVAVPGVDAPGDGRRRRAPGGGAGRPDGCSAWGSSPRTRARTSCSPRCRRLAERDWTCTIAGSTRRLPGASPSAVARDAQRFGGRVRLTGVLGGAAARGAPIGARGLLVAPSRVGELRHGDRRGARPRHAGPRRARWAASPRPSREAGRSSVPPDDPAPSPRPRRWMSRSGAAPRLRAEARRRRRSCPTPGDRRGARSTGRVWRHRGATPQRAVPRAAARNDCAAAARGRGRPGSRAARPEHPCGAAGGPDHRARPRQRHRVDDALARAACCPVRRPGCCTTGTPNLDRVAARRRRGATTAAAQRSGSATRGRRARRADGGRPSPAPPSSPPPRCSTCSRPAEAHAIVDAVPRRRCPGVLRRSA